MSQREQSGDLYRVKYKEGTHLASSRDTEGTVRAMLLDDETNKLVGHAELEKVDESEHEPDYSYDNLLDQQAEESLPEDQTIVEALAGAVIAGVIESGIVGHLWENKVIPFTKGMWKGYGAPNCQDRFWMKLSFFSW